ncbi:MAG: xanthine dehydrogenase accessory protein XdhC [Roseibium sp.]|uniref:xanthine dehydrogenase accessory protein XdhC n=1 Tax=Roseibium sp. TaxID=1936156 RepID=UPI0026269E7D|nr:xanthine dehydrogenase accessory protein XdhC [Roseibium sp.]MCV0425241.1 xanthine dehydrogenase accessory protein XdhC [Roseibium sp.]
MKVWGHIVDCLNGSGTCALVTVAGADGSTPREAGARMIVDRHARFYGTIGGGTLEFEAIRRAAKAADTGNPSFFVHSVSLGPDLGQCCGGRAQLAIEVLTTEMLEMAKALAELEASGGSIATRALVEEDRVLEREVQDTIPSRNFSLTPKNTTEKQYLVEKFGLSLRPLYLFGAGHVGKALVLSLAPLPFQVTWIDNRADQFPGPVPANVRKVCVADPASILETAPDGAFVLAMTHSHALDEDIMARALLRQSFAYCGVIGSKTKRSRFHKRLKSRGLSETLISSMVCPVGTTAIKSKQPAAIAAGIAVDLLQRDEANHQQVAAGEGLAQIVPLGQ